MRGADDIDPDQAWEILTRRPVKDGEASLIRSWSGKRWGVQIAWEDGSIETTVHASKDIAVDQFWRIPAGQ